MGEKQAQALMTVVILTRSSAYIFSKTGLETLGTFNLLAARFLLAFLVLGVIFRGRIKHISRHDLLGGAIIGAVFTGVMTFELTALKTTDTGTVSFVENTAIVWVPLVEAALIRKLPKPVNLITAVVALGGVALLTLRKGALGFTHGEALCMCAAVFYATGIIVTDRFSHKGDALLVGIVEVGTIGVLGLILALIFEQPRLPSGGTEWGCVLMLGLVCSAFGFTFQPVAQSHMDSQRAGLMCALNPAFASILGVLILHESMNIEGVLGAALILSSLFIPHFFSTHQTAHRQHHKTNRQHHRCCLFVLCRFISPDGACGSEFSAAARR